MVLSGFVLYQFQGYLPVRLVVLLFRDNMTTDKAEAGVFLLSFVHFTSVYKVETIRKPS